MKAIPIPGAELYYEEHFLQPEEATKLFGALVGKCGDVSKGLLPVPPQAVGQ
jgi:hypothetical protein